MSRRNKPDAKAARRRDREEPGHVFEKVALALDEAVCEITGGTGYDGDGFISSAFYAQAGAQLITWSGMVFARRTRRRHGMLQGELRRVPGPEFLVGRDR